MMYAKHIVFIANSTRNELNRAFGSSAHVRARAPPRNPGKSLGDPSVVLENPRNPRNSKFIHGIP